MRQIVILAGGLATRLYPLTRDKPKSLITILSEPFARFQIDNLVNLGIRKIHFCLGEHADLIEKYLSRQEFNYLDITVSHDSSPKRGTAGALLDANNYLEEEFLLTYGDSYLPVDIAKLEESWSHFDAPLKLSAKKTHNTRHKPNIELQLNGTFTFGPDALKPAYINYGLMLVNKNLIQRIKRESTFEFSNVIQNLSREKEAICMVTESALFEVGSFEGIIELENYFREAQNELHPKTP
jgi:NDP-sugar pyrophosphorylase family protein